jgi:membrane protein implicated in regulation of membrane protease activity
MDWWIWLLIGLFLALAEVVTPGGFYILFFGVGALVVGFLGLAGLGGPAWLQVLLFSIISVAALWLFREKLLQFSQVKTPLPVDSFIGETARVTEAIAVNEMGKAELRGTSWNARNVGVAPLASGARCVVERVEGLTLYVRAE